MLELLVRWFLNAVLVVVAAYLLPCIHVDSFLTALVVAMVLGLLNIIVKPLFILLTLPLTIISFGLFLLVINASLILLTSYIVPGFTVDGFWWALIYSILLSLFHITMNTLDKK